MSPSIDTLIQDIHSLFENGTHRPSEENLDSLCAHIREEVARSLEESGVAREQALRFSNMGRKERALWFDLKGNPQSDPGFSATQYINFLFGHMLEALLLFLTREAGHSVTHEQAEVTLKGIKGHTDCVIDGVVIDAKSASSFAFNKFKTGEIIRDTTKDPFGYVGQLSGYHEVLKETYPDEIDPSRAGWLVIDKQYGTLCLTMIDEMEMMNAEERIEKITHALTLDTPPEDKCYLPVKQTPSSKTDNGNRVLHSNCGYCKHKHLCWADSNNGKGLQGYNYSKGPVWFTEVVKEPNVSKIGDPGDLHSDFDIEE